MQEHSSDETDRPRGQSSELVQQFLRFAASGAVGTMAHYATLALLVEIAGVGPIAGSIVGFTVGAMVNYVLSRRFVFNSTVSHAVGIPRFVTIALMGVLINTAIMWVLISRIGLHYLVAQLGATGMVLLWNFVGNRWWTFSED